MAYSRTSFLFLCVLSAAPASSFPFEYRRNWIDPINENSSDNVECFLDYMELWVPRRHIDGLVLWLSRVMRFPVSVSSLDRTNNLLSRCRYFLDTDSDGNFLFRVHYSACNVQKEKGSYSLEIHMVTKTLQGNGQSDKYFMKCPAMAAALGREKVLCEPHYVQVSRPMPLGDSNDQSHWFLSLRGELVVSLEDASLIGVEVEMTNSSVTVRGLRVQLMNTKELMNIQTDVLPLWMAHGFYAYSLEASCPPVSQHPGAEVTLHIPKQRVGLVKRGSYYTETLTLRNIVVGPSINVTLTENKYFVVMTIPSNEVLQTKACITTIDNTPGMQFFYSIDLVLEFLEMAYPMNWTMENYYDCFVAPSQVLPPEHQQVFLKAEDNIAFSVNVTATRIHPQENVTPSVIKTTLANNLSLTHVGVSSLRIAEKIYIETPSPTTLPSMPGELPNAGTTTHGQFAETDLVASGEGLNLDISGSGDYSETQSSALNSSIWKIANGSTQESFLDVSVSHNRQLLRSLFITQQPKKSNLYKTVPSPTNSQNNTSSPEHILFNVNASNEQKIKQLLHSSEQSKMVTSSSLLDSEQNRVPFSANSTTGIYAINYKILASKDTNKQPSRETQPPTISEHGGAISTKDPITYSPLEKIKITSKYVELQDSDTLNSEIIISTSTHWPREDPWANLPVGTQSEFLDGTSSDGFIPFVSINSPSTRTKESDHNEHINSGKFPIHDQRMVAGQKQRPTENAARLARNLQQNTRSSSTEFSILQNSHTEEFIKNVPKELDQIAKDEHLMLSTTYKDPKAK